MDDEPVIARWGSLAPELAEALGSARELGADARESPRAWPLLDALAVDVEDERFELLQLEDGRWCLVGRRVEGARLAVEPAPPRSPFLIRSGRR
jgi:hypothetical protein